MTGAFRRAAGTGFPGVLFLLPVLAGCDGSPPAEPDAGGQEARSVAGALTGNGADGIDAGYARALGPRAFLFPDDLGAHPDYRHEWWYVTGNVSDASGRRFGYQVTFFRFAAPPGATLPVSRWSTRQLWMAHLAVTDPDGERFIHEERFSRGALDLAGARAEPFRVWLGEWELRASGGGTRGGVLPVLQAELEGAEAGVELELAPVKPLVFQGDRGYSRKGPDPGDASYYYTMPRLEAAGRLRVEDDVFEVTGTGWMDREWGTGTLSEDQVGWDWFSIQLDDGRELMFYHLRTVDGAVDERSKGGWVDASGAHRTVDADDVELEVLGSWESPDGRARYPAGWRLRYPEEDLDLTLEPLMADQELRGVFRYWEGALDVSGSADGKPVEGVGYAELTGYDSGDSEETGVPPR